MLIIKHNYLDAAYLVFDLKTHTWPSKREKIVCKFFKTVLPLGKNSEIFVHSSLCIFTYSGIQLCLLYGFGFLFLHLGEWGWSQNITAQKNAWHIYILNLSEAIYCILRLVCASRAAAMLICASSKCLCQLLPLCLTQEAFGANLLFNPCTTF